MLALAMGAKAAKAALTDRKDVIIACHNSPESVTLSGKNDEIDAIKKAMDSEGAFARVVSTGGNAYHSPHMKALGPEYESCFMSSLQSRRNREDEKISRPFTAFYSSVFGREYGTEEINAKYWRSNLESPVFFEQAVTSLVHQHPTDLLIEIGPHSALQGPLRQIAKSLTDIKFPEYVSTMIRNGDNEYNLLSAAGILFSKGYTVDWKQINSLEVHDSSINESKIQSGRTIVDLPKYQWQYKGTALYDENRFSREWRLRTHLRHDILGSRMPGGNEQEPVWRNVVKHKNLPWLNDHMVRIIRNATFLSSSILLSPHI